MHAEMRIPSKLFLHFIRIFGVRPGVQPGADWVRLGGGGAGVGAPLLA